jgi:hypothetical protein
MKPKDHKRGVSRVIWEASKVVNHLNTFTPVGIAIIIVAAVK